MATQRDFSVTWKKEMTSKNIDVLSKFQGMSPVLSRMIFKENALEKPTQNLFNHLSYYLISIIDGTISASLTWPLYDTKGNRAYRNQVASFISDYSNKGLVSPVMSSYLVNPGCYKVTVLMFQLSQLAVHRMLVANMKKDAQIKLYTEVTEKYKSKQKDNLLEYIGNETHLMQSKVSDYLVKRKTMERIADLFRKKITEMEKSLSSINAQSYIDNLVDSFIKTHEVDDETKLELENIKNINKQPYIFDTWLAHVDETIDTMEKAWDSKITSLLHSAQFLYRTTKALIARTTGQCDQSTYTIEYNHKKDEICTKELQNHVNSEQKYVLRNLVDNGQLNFPNLIKAFVVAISFILKHNEIGDEIYNFNEYLEGGKRDYSEIVSAIRVLIARMLNAEAKLQPTTSPYDNSLSIKDLPEIPPLPDLSNLKASNDFNQALFDTFTPFNVSKYSVNLRRKNSSTIFAKPQLRSFITPFHTTHRDEFLKNTMSSRMSPYDRHLNKESHNLSVSSNVNRVNETIAECSSGFSKQQILRLLSTKKSSSSKKSKYSTERPNTLFKKGGLFDESTCNESIGLIRSFSSPNLFENREKRSNSHIRVRKLSIMEEDSLKSILEMSGIATLDRDVNSSSPQVFGKMDGYRKIVDTSSMPVIAMTLETEKRKNIVDVEREFDKEMGVDSIFSPILEEPRNVNNTEISEASSVTPKTNTQLIKKTSSLEKIINRFKKVRANVIPEKKEVTPDIETIMEEKENVKSVNFDTAKKILLPDLLSPSSITELNVNKDYSDYVYSEVIEEESKKPRESLGTVLGVDHTILDQYDLSD